ncbi:hypothetical protein D3C87_1943510 [compost metagenome]
MVRKKSAGVGLLKRQRVAYSLNAWSNSSRPITVSRRMFNAVAGLPYALGPSPMTFSAEAMIGLSTDLSDDIYSVIWLGSPRRVGKL